MTLENVCMQERKYYPGLRLFCCPSCSGSLRKTLQVADASSYVACDDDGVPLVQQPIQPVQKKTTLQKAPPAPPQKVVPPAPPAPPRKVVHPAPPVPPVRLERWKRARVQGVVQGYCQTIEERNIFETAAGWLLYGAVPSKTLHRFVVHDPQRNQDYSVALYGVISGVGVSLADGMKVEVTGKVSGGGSIVARCVETTMGRVKVKPEPNAMPRWLVPLLIILIAVGLYAFVPAVQTAVWTWLAMNVIVAVVMLFGRFTRQILLIYPGIVPLLSTIFTVLMYI